MTAPQEGLLDAFPLFGVAIADLLDLGLLSLRKRSQLGCLFVVESLQARGLALVDERIALRLERLEVSLEFLAEGLELGLEGGRLRFVLFAERSNLLFQSLDLGSLGSVRALCGRFVRRFPRHGERGRTAVHNSTQHQSCHRYPRSHRSAPWTGVISRIARTRSPQEPYC